VQIDENILTVMGEMLMPPMNLLRMTLIRQARPNKTGRRAIFRPSNTAPMRRVAALSTQPSTVQ